MARKKKPLNTRFWSKVKKTDGCWEWTASVDRFGYGQVGGESLATKKHTMLKAHRVSWEMVDGPVPDGLWVLHHCDNRRCVRPDHLFLGNHQDNMNDMNRKGRNVFQTRNPSAKLTAEAIRTIRARRKAGELLRVIAADFGVTESTVCRIARLAQRTGVR